MGDNDAQLNINLNEIWRACRKIQEAISRYGFDICAEFCPHDPNKTGLVSESLFSVVLGKYKRIIGLSDFELREIIDYFRLRDGRVLYKQFCKIVYGESYDKTPKKDLATGLEWNDPMHVNVIEHPEERRQLCITLIKIALVSHLPLRPYFQDYELISKNMGTVTVSHFFRVLRFMKIPISDKDFLLLLKRYMKDSYMVNYVAFMHHIENIVSYLKENNLTDNANKIVKDFPGRLVELELPELPPVDSKNLAARIFKDYCNHPKELNSVCDIIACIQKHVYTHRVRIKQFLECFDLLHTSTITINQFARALNNIGVGKFINALQFNLLCERYIDPIDTNRIRWRMFEDEIDRVFTVKNLDKMPLVDVKTPPKHITKMLREGAANWQDIDNNTRNLCEEALQKIQERIRTRRLHLHPYFRNSDKHNSGHVRCQQTNQVFVTNGILLSNDELNALIDRYGDEMGFHYTKFLEDADPAEYAIPRLVAPADLQATCPHFNNQTQQIENEEYIIHILTKAKRQATTKGVALMQFLQDYDRYREGEILDNDFHRGMCNAGINMTNEEVKTICKIFRSPKRGCCILYRDFCKALDEIFVQIETKTADNAILVVPLMHLPNLDCVQCFLNFEERTLCSQALMKLARQPDEISNLKSIFQDYDRPNCGTVSKNQLLRALTIRDMNYMISNREFDVIFKCFGMQRGLDLEFKYREFLDILDVLYRNGQIKRNY